MDNKGYVMSNHPHPLFSKDWRKSNPWMEEIEAEDSFGKLLEGMRQDLDKIKKDSEPKNTKRVGICINFSEGIPLDYYIKQEIEKVAIMKNKSDKLAVFNEMMGEARGIGRVVKNYDK